MSTKAALTHLKSACMPTFSRWRSPGLALSACVAVACLGSVPARAVAYLDDPSTWVNATSCPVVDPKNCVESLGGGSYDILGADAAGNYTITSPTATIDTFISFSYTFDPFDSSLASAEYSLDSGSTYTALAVAANSASITPVLLTSGNTFSFRLINSGEQPLLGLTNFNATPVPAPLPLLGAGAAFGWIRRRRSQLKARQLGRQ